MLGVGADDAPLPEGVAPLSQFVEAPAALARRLAQIGVVEADRGPELARLLKPGQRLVTRDGALWRWDGFVVEAEAPTPAALRLARKNRLAALDGEIAVAAETLEEHRATFEALGEDLRGAGEVEAVSRQQVRERRGQAEAERQRVLRLERAHAEAEARLASLRDALERLSADLEEARLAAEEAGEAMREIENDAGLARAIEDARAALVEARAAAARERAAAEGIAREGEMRRRRIEAIARERGAWTQRAAGARQQVEILRERMEVGEEERAGLIEAPEEIELKRRELLGAISAAETARQAADDALVEAETGLREADRAAQAALAALSDTRERKIRAEERLGAATARKSEIETLIDEALEVPVSALPGLAGLKEGAPLPEPEAIERRVERLKSERERLGGVNLRAEEELREIEEQRGTLTSERDDLIEAIKRLRGAISNINREARERLLAAFDTVNAHFQRLFTHLFGGGTAELQLVDAEDPLDAGLEIVARPPGKKPQTMTLLSGGEQALTAMALIFAVFLTNPAPICVLDEVDAPLDDANVERYCDLLEEMTRSTATRFVVITHNPITMARMNRLFGVTMAERGVSQLVSVDLETAERFLEVV
jgi:chromosome segregation protein